MKQLAGNNIPLHQEVISDFIYHIRKHLQSKGLQYEFTVAPEVVLRNEDFKMGYIKWSRIFRNRASIWKY